MAKEAGRTGLLFPTTDGRVDTQMLPKLKAVAKRAGLDPVTVWLHKFRATTATGWLRNGRDVVTVQQLLGHSLKDLKSIMRYLAHLNNEQLVMRETMRAASAAPAVG